MEAAGKWKVLGEKVIDSSKWMDYVKSKIELPDGKIIDYFHVRYHDAVAGVLAIDKNGRILMVKSYRFTVDRTQWEIIAGSAEKDERMEDAARRELKEETGYTAKRLEKLVEYYPSAGKGDHRFVLFVARGLRKASRRIDTNEIMGVRFFPVSRIRKMIERGEIMEGMTLTGLLIAFFKGMIR
ncbi:MAG: NUDIX hydrolase [Candidatus Aenigmarchaeota archaeon]|nr:NUDIX hydrolase [Candidatus Aenigmarchaeota archaeon]